VARTALAAIAILASAGIIWATRSFALWEFATAFRPPMATYPTERAFSRVKPDWRAHLALARTVWPSGLDQQQASPWRLEHLATALKTCPKDTRPAIRVNTVSVAWETAPNLPALQPREEFRARVDQILNDPQASAALTRLREVALAGEQADPNNAYFDTALAYVAFARGEDDEAARHLAAASAKPWRRYEATTIEAIRRTAGRAHVLPLGDPLFALEVIDWSGDDSRRISQLQRAVLRTAETYVRQGRAREAEQLLQATIALGKSIQKGAFWVWFGERDFGEFMTLAAYRAYRDLLVQHGSREQIGGVWQQSQRFLSDMWFYGDRAGKYALPFWRRYLAWRALIEPIADSSRSLLRLLCVLAAFLLVAGVRGVRLPTEAPVSSDLLVLTALVAFVPTVVTIGTGYWLGPPESQHDHWRGLARLLTLDAAWLFPLSLTLVLAAVAHPPISPLSRSLRVAACLSCLACVGCGTWSVWWVVSRVREQAEGIFRVGSVLQTAPPLSLAALAVFLVVWLAVLVRRRRALLDQVESRRSRRREVLANFTWLSLRLLAACAVVILAALLVHLFFLATIGDEAQQVLRRGDVSLVFLGWRI